MLLYLAATTEVVQNQQLRPAQRIPLIHRRPGKSQFRKKAREFYEADVLLKSMNELVNDADREVRLAHPRSTGEKKVPGLTGKLSCEATGCPQRLKL